MAALHATLLPPPARAPAPAPPSSAHAPRLARGRPPPAAAAARHGRRSSNTQPPFAAARNANRRSIAPRANLDDLLSDMDVPDIDCDLSSYQEDAGAVMSEDGVALTFNQDPEAVKAFMDGAAVVDLSHWGRVRVAGDDRLRYLHNMTTNEFKEAKPGETVKTVFVSPQARTIDLASCYIQGSGVLITVSPETKGELLTAMDKYIFPADKVEVMDISEQCSQLALVGPGAEEMLREMGFAGAADLAPGQHTVVGVQDSPVIVGRGSALPGDGYVLMPDQSVAGELWRLLVVRGAVPMGADCYDAVRTVLGVPAPGSELTEDYNPYEAGLCDAVSLRKGCFMGQETLAKVYTTGRLKQELWGLQLDAPVEVGDAIELGGKAVGVVTSVAQGAAVRLAHHRYWDGEHFALGYVRQRAGGQGLKVTVGPSGHKAMLLDVDHAVREVPEGQRPEAAGKDAEAGGGQKKEGPTEEEIEEEERRKAEKLAAMQARMDAYLASQKKAADGS